MKYWVLSSVLLLSALSVQAGNWFEDFDAMPAGAIDTQPGWEGSYSTIDVVTGGALSSIHALDLPQSSVGIRTAEYDLLDVNCADKILRVSFKVQRAHNGQSFRMNLIDGGATRLYISTDTSDGTITINGTDTGVAYGNNQFVTLTLLYNEDSNKVSLNRNGVEILPWTDLGLTHFTSLDTVQFRRVSGAAPSGTMLVDSVSIQAIDDMVLGWWRFEEGTGTLGTEESGNFNAATYTSQPDGGWDAASFALGDLFNGDGVVDDYYARLNTWMAESRPNKSLSLGSNWTLEFIASFDGYINCTLLDWVNDTPPQSAGNTWIKVDWFSGNQKIIVSLRDSQQSDSAYSIYDIAHVPRDGEYHHLAIVKSGDTLTGYVDYKIQTNVVSDMETDSDGTYDFDLEARVYLGQEYNGENKPQNGIRFDEFRFCQGTGLERFLRINQPFFVGLGNVTPTTSELTFVCAPEINNTIRRQPDITRDAWINVGTYGMPTNYIGKLKTITVTNPIGNKGFFRFN